MGPCATRERTDRRRKRQTEFALEWRVPAASGRTGERKAPGTEPTGPVVQLLQADFVGHRVLVPVDGAADREEAVAELAAEGGETTGSRLPWATKAGIERLAEVVSASRGAFLGMNVERATSPAKGCGWRRAT